MSAFTSSSWRLNTSSPALFILHDRVISPKFVSDEVREEDEIDEPGEVIIAGYGRIGTVVDRMLLTAGFKTTVIDYDSNQIDTLRKFGARKLAELVAKLSGMPL